MPGFTEHKIRKIQRNLQRIFEELGGKQVAQKTTYDDPFTQAKADLTQQIDSCRTKLSRYEQLKKEGKNIVEQISLKNDIQRDLEELSETHETISEQVSKNGTEKQAVLLEKYRQVIATLRTALEGEFSGQVEPRSVDNLADLKGLSRSVVTQNVYGTHTAEDDQILEDWKQKDAKLDDRLDEINGLLADVREMNRNLGDQIDRRGALMDEVAAGTEKVNGEVVKQNKSLVETLNAYRAPGKLCIDFCLVILFLGLLTVLVGLVRGGKRPN